VDTGRGWATFATIVRAETIDRLSKPPDERYLAVALGGPRYVQFTVDADSGSALVEVASVCQDPTPGWLSAAGHAKLAELGFGVDADGDYARLLSGPARADTLVELIVRCARDVYELPEAPAAPFVVPAGPASVQLEVPAPTSALLPQRPAPPAETCLPTITPKPIALTIVDGVLAVLIAGLVAAFLAGMPSGAGHAVPVTTASVAATHGTSAGS
jgi:hypothetical protein